MSRSLAFAGQAEVNRDLARRARRLADSQADPLERQRLYRYADDLMEGANRLEREAIELRPLVVAPPANDPTAATD